MNVVEIQHAADEFVGKLDPLNRVMFLRNLENVRLRSDALAALAHALLETVPERDTQDDRK